MATLKELQDYHRMKAKELRIGNLLDFGDPIVTGYDKKYCDITPKGILEFSMGRLTVYPIPITKEWLIKFGFVDDELHLDIKETGCIDTIYFNDGKIGTSSSEYYGLHNIQYVHQLQNLYFALTGKEL